MVWQTFCHLLQDIFYPNRCVECHYVVEDNTLFCPSCRQKMLLQGGLAGMVPAGSKLKRLGSLYAYESGVRQTFHSIKFSGGRYLLPRLSEEVCTHLDWQYVRKQWHLPKAIKVVPLPTEPVRRQQRGYDIPWELFYAWCSQENLEWYPALSRKAGLLPQYGLSKVQRRQNVAGSFRLKAQVENCSLLLVDDIITTGATLEEAAGVLLEGGARQVWGLSFSGSRI